MQFDELMESLKTFSREMKAPIVIGEFGSMDLAYFVIRLKNQLFVVIAETTRYLLPKSRKALFIRIQPATIL